MPSKNGKRTPDWTESASHRLSRRSEEDNTYIIHLTMNQRPVLRHCSVKAAVLDIVPSTMTIGRKMRPGA